MQILPFDLAIFAANATRFDATAPIFLVVFPPDLELDPAKNSSEWVPKVDQERCRRHLALLGDCVPGWEADVKVSGGWDDWVGGLPSAKSVLSSRLRDDGHTLGLEGIDLMLCSHWNVKNLMHWMQARTDLGDCDGDWSEGISRNQKNRVQSDVEQYDAWSTVVHAACRVPIVADFIGRDISASLQKALNTIPNQYSIFPQERSSIKKIISASNYWHKSLLTDNVQYKLHPAWKAYLHLLDGLLQGNTLAHAERVAEHLLSVSLREDRRHVDEDKTGWDNSPPAKVVKAAEVVDNDVQPPPPPTATTLAITPTLSTRAWDRWGRWALSLLPGGFGGKVQNQFQKQHAAHILATAKREGRFMEAWWEVQIQDQAKASRATASHPPTAPTECLWPFIRETMLVMGRRRFNISYGPQPPYYQAPPKTFGDFFNAERKHFLRDFSNHAQRGLPPVPQNLKDHDLGGWITSMAFCAFLDASQSPVFDRAPQDKAIWHSHGHRLYELLYAVDDLHLNAPQTPQVIKMWLGRFNTQAHALKDQLNIPREFKDMHDLCGAWSPVEDVWRQTNLKAASLLSRFLIRFISHGRRNMSALTHWQFMPCRPSSDNAEVSHAQKQWVDGGVKRCLLNLDDSYPFTPKDANSDLGLSTLDVVELLPVLKDGAGVSESSHPFFQKIRFLRHALALDGGTIPDPLVALKILKSPMSVILAAAGVSLSQLPHTPQDGGRAAKMVAIPQKLWEFVHGDVAGFNSDDKPFLMEMSRAYASLLKDVQNTQERVALPVFDDAGSLNSDWRRLWSHFGGLGAASGDAAQMIHPLKSQAIPWLVRVVAGDVLKRLIEQVTRPGFTRLVSQNIVDVAHAETSVIGFRRFLENKSEWALERSIAMTPLLQQHGFLQALTPADQPTELEGLGILGMTSEEALDHAWCLVALTHPALLVPGAFEVGGSPDKDGDGSGSLVKTLQEHSRNAWRLVRGFTPEEKLTFVRAALFTAPRDERMSAENHPSAWTNTAFYVAVDEALRDLVLEPKPPSGSADATVTGQACGLAALKSDLQWLRTVPVLTESVRREMHRRGIASTWTSRRLGLSPQAQKEWGHHRAVMARLDAILRPELQTAKPVSRGRHLKSTGL